MNSRLAQKLGIAAGQPVRVNGARLDAVLDETVARRLRARIGGAPRDDRGWDRCSGR